MDGAGLAAAKPARMLQWAEDRRIAAATLAFIILCAVALYWHGFGPGDAERYVRGAMRWVEDGFYLGETHWSLRHPFVVPMALSFALFGANEFTATIPNIAYAAGLVAITYVFAARYIGAAEAFLTAAFVAASAFFVARPLEVDVYGAEIFFAALAAWLFVAGEMEGRKLSLIAGAGAAAGIAWLVREQTIYIIGALAAATIWLRKGVDRSLFALVGGFAAVIAVEWAYYAIVAGDPFYRYEIDLRHRRTGVAIHFASEDNTLAKRILRPFGDLLTYPTTTPFLLLAALAAWRPGWRVALQPPSRRFAFWLFGLLSLVAVPVSAFIFNLAFPRYYPILTYFLFLAIGLAAAEIWRRWGPAAGAGCALLVVGLNAAAADFSRYNEYYEARYLAELAQQRAPIETDPLTASRARYQLWLRGVPISEASRRIIGASEPSLGGLYFKSHASPPWDPRWCALEFADVRPLNWTHALLRKTGLDKLSGSKIRSTVAKPSPVALVRPLPTPAETDPITGAPCLRPLR
jgi:4-amino-4-deoxy-L-arabinose transferase-like glycosyltransferase